MSLTAFRFITHCAMISFVMYDSSCGSWDVNDSLLSFRLSARQFISVIDGEPDRLTRFIKEAIHICKEGPKAMNRNEGSYQLSHAYDCFLGTSSSRRVKNRKN